MVGMTTNDSNKSNTKRTREALSLKCKQVSAGKGNMTFSGETINKDVFKGSGKFR